MKVILLEDVKAQGKKGQLIEVSDGYARNYLFPRKLAAAATADTLNALKLKDAAAKNHEIQETNRMRALAERLKSCVIKVCARAGANGRLFGSVTSKEIAEALKEQFDIELDRHKIVLDEPIKQFGAFELRVKFGHEVSGSIHILVDSEST
ncbi:50S ribosomal protein L9 [Clostridia bacterium]|nr:50S ribosomal protein L9 [Clostridia bacterium]